MSSKQVLKLAKRTLTGQTGGKGKRRQGESKDHHGTDGDAAAAELSRCNSYDYMAAAAASGQAAAAADGTTAAARDAETLYFHERHLVPVDTVRSGMSRFSFLLETCSPGSVPDPLLVSSLLDLVRKCLIPRYSILFYS